MAGMSSMGQPRHVLVTGGAGFIGSHLVERLLKDGKSVVVMDDMSTGSPANLQAVHHHPRLRVIHSRISECAELAALTAQSESIYHLAATVGVELVLESPFRAMQTNLRETEAVLEAANHCRVPVLITSSSEVYGKSEKELFQEGDDLLIGPPTHPRWSYACSKLMGEFLALAYAREKGLPVIIARLFNTVGPRQTGRYGMVLPRFIAQARAGQRLIVFGDGRQTRRFCHVLDTVEALVRLQNCPAARGEVFNVGGTEEIRILELAKLVVSILHSKSTIELVPYPSVHLSSFEDMRRRRPDTKKLRAATGFTPARTLAQLVEHTAELGG